MKLKLVEQAGEVKRKGTDWAVLDKEEVVDKGDPWSIGGQKGSSGRKKQQNAKE